MQRAVRWVGVGVGVGWVGVGGIGDVGGADELM